MAWGKSGLSFFSLNAAVSVLMLPGWTNSGPGHWQSLWEKEHPEYKRVEQSDWEAPDRADWLRTIEQTICDSPSPVMLVCHSLGCTAAVAWAEHADPVVVRRVAGAFLVAPPDVERPAAPEVLLSWRPNPLNRLLFPSVLIASRNDDSCSFLQSRKLAAAWGSSFVDIGDAGHIHTAAGYGPWPEGKRMLNDFIRAVI